MPILITGSKGQLGSELRILSKRFHDYQFTCIDVLELNLTNQNKVDAYLQQLKPSVIINCAAYTAVDKAEEEPEKAFALNSDAVGHLARYAVSSGALLIHISTDFVFDGKHKIPYTEEDTPHPLSVYGQSKLKGEDQIRESGCNAIIIRTSWLYSAFGNNFVKTILAKGRERGMLDVVSDQTGSPTYAYDLALLILTLLPKFMLKEGFHLYHFANEGAVTWFDLAIHTFRISGKRYEVHPIPSKSFPSLATRPKYSVLDKTKIKTEFGIKIPGWEDSLRKCVKQLTY
ncbi:MAG: dTDP-4-dehydrorhamnose reductase [Bacteroidetes bacterium]|nr:dTDP-4-dehydrorhamnose reductase [Bacteroidota bacterium]